MSVYKAVKIDDSLIKEQIGPIFQKILKGRVDFTMTKGNGLGVVVCRVDGIEIHLRFYLKDGNLTSEAVNRIPDDIDRMVDKLNRDYGNNSSLEEERRHFERGPFLELITWYFDGTVEYGEVSDKGGEVEVIFPDTGIIYCIPKSKLSEPS